MAKIIDIVSTHTYPFRIWSGCAAEVLGDVNAEIIAPNTDSDDDSDDEDKKNKGKKNKKFNSSDSEEEKLNKKKSNKKKEASSDSDSEEEKPKKKPDKKSTGKKKEMVSSDSDSDSEEEKPKKKPVKKSTRKKKAVSSDSDSEEEKTKKKPVKKSTGKKKEVLSSDSDSEEEKPKKKLVKKSSKKYSDSDSEDEKPKNKLIKKSTSSKKTVKKSNKKNSDSDSEDEKPKKKLVKKSNKKDSDSGDKKKSNKKLVNKGHSKGKKEKDVVKVHSSDIEVTPKKKKGRPKKSDQSSKFKYEENVDDQKNAETTSSGGIKIIAVNPAHTVLVYTHLPAKNFERFKCKKKKITIGLNLPNFHKFIKTMAKESTLTLFMKEDDMNQLEIRVDNSNKNRISNFKLNLLDLEKVNLEFERAEYESYIRMPAEDFKQTCKNMQNIAELVEIKNVDKQLSFMCEGEIGVHEEIYGQQDKGMKVNNEAEIVQGVFEIKYLVQFSKCAPLCDNIELYMRNDYPLIIKFAIPTLGVVYFCQSPVLDNKKNDDDVINDKDRELSDISDDDD